MKKVQLLKRRDFGAVLNDTFTFVFENALAYSKAFLYFVMPPLLILMLVMTVLFTQLGLVMGDMQENMRNMGGFDVHRLYTMGTAYTIMLVMMSIVHLLQSLLAYEYILLYETKPDPKEITTSELWSAMMGSLGNMIGSYLGMFGLIIGFVIVNVAVVALLFAASKVLGGILVFVLIFVWIYLALPLASFYIIRLREGLGIMDSLSRCFTLVRNNWWRTFGVIMVMGVAASAMQMMITAPIAAPDMISTIQKMIKHPGDTSGIYSKQHSIVQAVQTAVGVFFSVLVIVATAINYYSLVEGTDNTSLQEEIARIGEAPDPEYKQEGEF